MARPLFEGGNGLPRDADSPSTYVISASSLLAVLQLPGQGATAALDGLVAMATAGRLQTVSLVWSAVAETPIGVAFQVCMNDFVVRELDLQDEIRIVLNQCGEDFLGNDPTLEDPEPWLVALALRLGATVVSEPSALSRLPWACNGLSIPLGQLADVIAVEMG